MREDDDLRAAFAPLRARTTPSESDVARARRAASDGTASGTRRTAAARDTVALPRRRWLLGGTGAVAAAGLAILAAAVVDSSHPGTFVGEAGAKELLLAAADATRDEPAPDGWRHSTVQRVQRLALEGRRCRTCATERAILETRSTEERWDGPRGEAYSVARAAAPRAIENEPLLRAKHALDAPRRPRTFPGLHVAAARPGAHENEGPLGLGGPGGLADPTAVPGDPDRLVRWASDRIAAIDRALRRAEARGGGGSSFSISRGTRVSFVLVDVATSPQLSGAQRAAAFEALAGRPRVAAVPPPAPFASAERVAVRIASAPPAGRRVDREAMPVPDRVVVFDRGSHRIVAEESRTVGDQRASFQFGEGRTRRLMRLVAGGGAETRYDEPVDVAGPGVDAAGRRTLRLDGLTEMDRSGRSTDPDPAPEGRRRSP